MTNVYQKALFAALTGATLIAVGACTSDNTATIVENSPVKETKAEKTPPGYVKPGASIQFSHNYDGKTAPGEVEEFQIFITGGSLHGNVDVNMQHTDGLKIYSNTAAVQKLSIAEDAPEGLDHTMNMSVGSQTPGRYYLKFIASSDHGSGEPMMRSFGIAIQVGDQPYEPELGTGMTAEETPTGEKIITMEAEETIEN